MDFELDHLFVYVSQGAGLEADWLARLGLAEGEPNTHPGQGTACRRFFFANAYLELIWVGDPDEAQSEMARPWRLWERWSGRSAGACPFGVCLRPSRPEVTGLPFAAWPYRPGYLPKPFCLHVGEDSSSADGPLLIYLPFGRRPDFCPQPRPLSHPVGFQTITRVLVRGPQPPSPVAEEAALKVGDVAFELGREHLLEIGFDGERAGLEKDLRPLLPLRLLW